MGKIELQQFYIVLDKSDAVYGPGEVVSGRCFIVLKGQLDTSQLEIKLKGAAEVKWAESLSNRSTVYKNKHSHVNLSFRPAQIDQKIIHVYKRRFAFEVPPNFCDTAFCSDPNPDSNKFNTLIEAFNEKTLNNIIPMGKHNIPFTFQLPTSLIASSFVGKYGSIRYWIKAIIHKTAMLSSDHKTTLPFVVFVPPSVSMTELQAHVEKSNEKKVGFFTWFTSDLVKMTAKINHVGQKIGTSVSILCTVENKSRKRITPKVTLKQKQIFHAGGKIKCHEESIIKTEGTSVEPGSTVNETLVLHIPYGLPILYNQCPIIQINDHIRVTLDIPGSFDLHVDLPVILSNQPLNFDTHKTSFHKNN